MLSIPILQANLFMMELSKEMALASHQAGIYLSSAFIVAGLFGLLILYKK